MENTEYVWGIPNHEFAKTHLFETLTSNQGIVMRRYCHKTNGFTFRNNGYYILLKTEPYSDLNDDYYNNLICKTCLKSREGKRLEKLILYESI